MSNMRLKGRHVKVSCILDDEEKQALFEHTKSIDVTFLISISSEDYLGKPTPLSEEDFEGADINIPFHMTNDDYWDVLEEVVRRAQNNEAGAAIDITAVFDFPDGTVGERSITFPDVKLTRPTLNAAGRKDFASGTISAHSDDVRFN